MSSHRRPRMGLGRRLAQAMIDGSPTLSAVDSELSALAEFRRRHQAHPMDRELDPEFDVLADGWADRATPIE